MRCFSDDFNLFHGKYEDRNGIMKKEKKLGLDWFNFHGVFLSKQFWFLLEKFGVLTGKLPEFFFGNLLGCF